MIGVKLIFSWRDILRAAPQTKRTDVLPQDLVKSRNREIWCYYDRIALKFDISAALLEGVWKRLNTNPAYSRLHEILQYDVLSLHEYRPWLSGLVEVFVPNKLPHKVFWWSYSRIYVDFYRRHSMHMKITGQNPLKSHTVGDEQHDKYCRQCPGL